MQTFERYQNIGNQINLGDLATQFEAVKQEIKKVIIGQDELLDYLMIALLSDGHVLLEGLPGVAKTITARLLAKTIKADFNRIQFTPDLMPADVTGTSILDMRTNEFEFKQGPLFSNIILIDEINRAPAKTQAALFESMSEQQITVDGHTYVLERPFLVLATQNPVDQEGTYRLPEAQMDRFLFKLKVPYPSLEAEIKILQEVHDLKNVDKLTLVQPIIEKTDLIRYQNIVRTIYIHEEVIQYIAKIIVATREHPYLLLGASPRASIAILQAAKAAACINNRDYVTPEDVKKVIFPILSHRIQLTPEREMEGMQSRQVIEQIIDSVETPH